jgi:hypothetical protein
MPWFSSADDHTYELCFEPSPICLSFGGEATGSVKPIKRPILIAPQHFLQLLQTARPDLRPPTIPVRRLSPTDFQESVEDRVQKRVNIQRRESGWGFARNQQWSIPKALGTHG